MAKNTHNKLLEEVSLDMVVEDYTTQHESHHIMKNKRVERRLKMYHIYDTLINVRNFARKGYPLSIIRLKNGLHKIVICFGRNCECKSVTEKLIYVGSMSDRAMNCHDIYIEEDLDDIELEEFDHGNVEHYLLCLPMVKESNHHDYENAYTYYIIDSNWLELNECGKLIHSKCP